MRGAGWESTGHPRQRALSPGGDGERVAEVSGLMLQLGFVLLIAFLGALLASRLKVSVIIAYILAGLFLGPHLRFDLGGISYGGLLTDQSLISELSQIGLVLLLFFVGLEFSVAKLRRVKEAAAILAIINLAVNMFGGFVLGAYLGWPLVDTIFLAGVVSMSSSAITAKLILELRKLTPSESEFLLGMVVLESFMAMFLLTLVNGLVVTEGGPGNLVAVVVGVLAFVGLFAFLAAFVIPRVAASFDHVKSDELFVLFALGLVFLAAAFAELFHIPAIIGAFFLGMTFADTPVAARLQEKIAPFRDAFVALFFISFGAMIDPAFLPLVAPMLLIAIPLIFLNDLLVTGALAHLIGLSGKASTAVGASLLGRNEEAILYASVGTKAIQANPGWSNAYAGTLLSPFAGLLCIVMSSLAPTVLRRSERVAAGLTRITPRSLAFGGELVKRTLRTFFFPADFPLYRRTKWALGGIAGFFTYLLILTVTTGAVHIILSAGVPLSIYLTWTALRKGFAEPVKHTNYGMETGLSWRFIQRFVLRFVVSALAAMALIAALWQLYWPSTLVVVLGYVLYVLAITSGAHRRFVLPTAPPPQWIHARPRNGR